jgi:hypothetical protein
MQAKVYCKTVAKGRQAFYLNANGKDYFLFEQDFRKSNKEFFVKGYYLTDKVDYTKVKSTSVRKTLNKLPSFIRYIESEFGVSIYNKTKCKEKPQKVKKAYKRKPFLWNQYNWEVA